MWVVCCENQGAEVSCCDVTSCLLSGLVDRCQKDQIHRESKRGISPWTLVTRALCCHKLCDYILETVRQPRVSLEWCYLEVERLFSLGVTSLLNTHTPSFFPAFILTGRLKWKSSWGGNGHPPTPRDLRGTGLERSDFLAWERANGGGTCTEIAG